MHIRINSIQVGEFAAAIGPTLNGGFGIAWCKLGGAFGTVTLFAPWRDNVRHVLCWNIYGRNGRVLSIR